MSRDAQTVPADQPLGRRLLDGLGYPLRGAALASLAAFSLAHVLTDWLPVPFNIAGGVVVWASLILYAMECLRRTANGFAEPPEVALYSGYAPALSLLTLQMLGVGALLLTITLEPGLWGLVLAIQLVVPAIAMSLAFEDHLLAALNPLRWGVAISAFGAGYLLPLLAGFAETMAYYSYLRSAPWLLRSLTFAGVVYLYLLQFHLIGMLMHRHHDSLGLTPEADTLAEASGTHADEHLLEQAERLDAAGKHQAARVLLTERLRQRDPPLRVFAAQRELLRRHDDRRALLDTAHAYLARLLADGCSRRALGVVRECIDLDPHFLPDQPDVLATLADAASDQGMTQLALKLSRGFPNAWPRDPRAPHYGLLAARLLAERLDRRAEAGVLAHKLLRAYPQRPAQPEIERFLADLGMQAPPKGTDP